MRSNFPDARVVARDAVHGAGLRAHITEAEMTLLVWLSLTLGLVIFLAVTVTPLWLVLRHPDRRPAYDRPTVTATASHVPAQGRDMVSAGGPDNRPVPSRSRATPRTANSGAGHVPRSAGAHKNRLTVRPQAKASKSPR